MRQLQYTAVCCVSVLCVRVVRVCVCVSVCEESCSYLYFSDRQLNVIRYENIAV